MWHLACRRLDRGCPDLGSAICTTHLGCSLGLLATFNLNVQLRVKTIEDCMSGTWSAGRRSPSSRRSQRRSRGRCRHSGRCIRAPPGRGCSAMGRRPLLVKAEVGCMFSQVACRGCQCFGGILDAGLPSQFCQCFAGVRIDGNRIAQTRRLHVDREVCFRKEGLYRSEHFPHGDRGPSSKVVDI